MSYTGIFSEEPSSFAVHDYHAAGELPFSKKSFKDAEEREGLWNYLKILFW